MAAVRMVVGEDNFRFAVGYQLTGFELCAVDHELRAEVEVSVMDAHSGTVGAVGLIIAERLDDVGLSVSCCIEQSDVSSLFRTPRLDIDVAVVASIGRASCRVRVGPYVSTPVVAVS